MRNLCNPHVDVFGEPIVRPRAVWHWRRPRRPAARGGRMPFKETRRAMHRALARAFALPAAVALAAGIVWTGPKLAPNEAARIMASAPGLANRTDPPAPLPEDGPRVAISDGSPNAGPFGALALRSWSGWSHGSGALRGSPWGRGWAPFGQGGRRR